MNTKGDMDDIISGVVLLFVAILTIYITMAIWSPITSIYLYPLLNNAEAFGSMGGITVTILQIFPLMVVAGLFIAFFAHIQGKGRDRPQF